jgi:sugar phosphate isomerase/epimerase
MSADSMHVLHMNDYPADPPREKITDAYRVYPGDGIAPLGEILRTLKAIGYRGVLSLELFNESYWKQHDALTVAETGLKKMREVVQKAFA